MKLPPKYGVVTLGIILGFFFLVACTSTTILLNSGYSDESELEDSWVMLGGLTYNSVSLRIRNEEEVGLSRLVVTNDASDIVVLDKSINGSSNDFVTSVTISELNSSTTYSYEVLDSRNISLNSGTFKTAPVEGSRSNFKFAASGCAMSRTQNEVFSMIQDDNPLFFIHIGDIHYEDISENDVGLRVRALDRMMASPHRRRFHASLPMTYIYDDHDWLGNDSNGLGSGKESALETYRVAMPYHDPLPSSQSSYHAFSIGTVRFILTDLRSDATRTQLISDAQKEWFFGELRNSSDYDFVVWISSLPWGGAFEEGDDAWKAFPDQRREISEFISNVVPNNLIAVGGDAHMVAFDDGSNTYYGRNSTSKSFPILQTAPLDRHGSFKGGLYSDGCKSFSLDRNHQYSVIEFLGDAPEGPCLKIVSYRITLTNKKEEIFSKMLCGGDIFTESNPGIGSCDAMPFSPPTLSLVVVSSCLLAFVFMETCFLAFPVWKASTISLFILLMYSLTLLMGWAIPKGRGIGQVRHI